MDTPGGPWVAMDGTTPKELIAAPAAGVKVSARLWIYNADDVAHGVYWYKLLTGPVEVPVWYTGATYVGPDEVFALPVVVTLEPGEALMVVLDEANNSAADPIAHASSMEMTV